MELVPLSILVSPSFTLVLSLHDVKTQQEARREDFTRKKKACILTLAFWSQELTYTCLLLKPPCL